MPDLLQRTKVEGEGGLHRDGDKPRFVDYFPVDLLWHVGAIAAENNQPCKDYKHGKYPDLEGGHSNYRGGIMVLKILDSTFRHFLKILMGEDIDRDSGRPHIAHMICDLGMAHWMIRHRPDMDNRLHLAPDAREVDVLATLDRTEVK